MGIDPLGLGEVRVSNTVNRLAVLITGIEVVVLVEWLRLITMAAAAVAAGFLVVGILVEEFVRFRGIKSRFPQGRELLLVLLGVAVEAVGWILPLVLKSQRLLTFAILFVALDIEHAIINLATTGKFALGAVVDFSALEAVGGTIWLTNPSVGTIALLIGTSILEHVRGIRQGLGLRS
jgi:hypothetical protein